MDISSALVTGANKGIGRATARELIRRGLTVYVCSRSAERAADAAAEIGGDARPLRLDVTDAASIADAASGIDSLDVLINNAGISDESLPAQDEEVDAFRRIYETNVFGPVAVTNAFLPLLRRSDHPRIVNLSSGTGSLTWSTERMGGYRGAFASYRSSKAALNALTIFYSQSLAEDGIKVNAVAPGLRHTDLNANAVAAVADPAEAARAVVRLALIDDDGPSGTYVNFDGTPVPW
ncbi:SDR family NAD(P)-dependent oxidoreductase [Streptomyces sp. NPDC058653]|uniref:SDR family NAD(P)-dependent oxidoreductase n=1 Tax=Streptomyces sp. NPDC058653 TaxID=3346576 RepID=UPI00366081D9